MRKLKYLLFIVPVAAVVFMLRNPLRRNEREIEAHLYLITPVGSSYVVAVSKLGGCYSQLQSYGNAGFFKQELPQCKTVGAKSIKVDLGEYYHFPIGMTSVVAFWGFDQNGKLLEVWVWKTTDSI